jgi:hypothetical protein
MVMVVRLQYDFLQHFATVEIRSIRESPRRRTLEQADSLIDRFDWSPLFAFLLFKLVNVLQESAHAV